MLLRYLKSYIYNSVAELRKKKPDGYWDVKEHVMEEGKKYRNRTAFSEGAYTAWKKAKQYGWIDEIEWA